MHNNNNNDNKRTEGKRAKRADSSQSHRAMNKPNFEHALSRYNNNNSINM